eukprot:TRINITY_DN7553_c0_g1_i1.p1 TRINITY_DN7553_c0_g1~~TRINITY_DN7553_c0_g1_i1.p1  ORF type:complete len:521 (+),score=145.65 TRINITY_DN7553_c0_g1_i1:255-1817(+)
MRCTGGRALLAAQRGAPRKGPAPAPAHGVPGALGPPGVPQTPSPSGSRLLREADPVAWALQPPVVEDRPWEFPNKVLDWSDGNTASFLQNAWAPQRELAKQRRDLVNQLRPVPHLRRQLQELKERGAAVGAHSHAVAIALLGSWGAHRTARQLYDSMRDQGVEQNAAVHCSMMYAYAVKGMPDGVRDVLKNLREEGYTPDIAMYNISLLCCQRLGDEAGAFRVVRAAAAAGLRPTIHTANTLILACSCLPPAWRVYQKMRAGEWGPACAPTSTTFSCLIRTCRSDPFGGERVLQEMRECDKVDVRAYNQLMAAYKHTGDFKGVVAVYRRMRAEPGVEPDQITFNLFLRACALRVKERPTGEASRWVRLAEAVFEQAVDEGFADSDRLFTSLAQIYAELGRLEKMQQLRARMHQAGFPDSPCFLAELHRAHVAAGRDPNGMLWVPLPSASSGASEPVRDVFYDWTSRAGPAPAADADRAPAGDPPSEAGLPTEAGEEGWDPGADWFASLPDGTGVLRKGAD